MSCIIESKKGKGIESPLGKELTKIYKDIDKASDVYSKLSHPSFIEKFGDWINDDITERTNDIGEPLLIARVGVNGARNYYFQDKYGNELDLITNEFSSFPTSNLTNVISEITQQLGNYVFNKHIKKNFNDLENLKGIDLNKEIISFVDDKIAENKEFLEFAETQDEIDGQNYIIEQLNNVKTHADEFKVELFNYFKGKNLIINETKSEDDTQQALEEGLQGGDIRQSFENNTKDKATANTKLLLSFLPRYEYSIEDGEYIVKYGSLLDEQTFMNMDSIHQELLKEFSDIVPNETINGIEDVYDIMINKISELAKSKPYYNDLLSIMEELDESKKNEFVVAFSHKFNNFTVSSWDSKNNTYIIINSSTQNDVDTQILNNWAKAFKNKFLTEEIYDKKSIDPTTFKQIVVKGKRNAYDKKLIDKLEKDLKTLSDTFYSSNKNYDINNISNEDFAERFYISSLKLDNILKDLGVELQENAFRYYISKLNSDSLNSNRSEYIETMISTINHLRSAVKVLNSNRLKVKNFNLITSYKSGLFGDLAKAEAFYNEDLTDTNVLANNKMYWAFSNPSYISNTVNKYKSSPETLKQLTRNEINTNSKWVEHLLGEEKNEEGDYKYDEEQRAIESKKNLESFRLDTFTSFQEEGKSAEGVSNKDISETDQLIDEINKVERAGIKNAQGNRIGYTAVYSTSTPADKPTRHEITTKMYLDDVVVTANNSGEFSATYSEEILNIAKNYFLDEVNRMKKAAKELNTLDEKDYIVHYHTVNGKTVDENGVVLGNAFKSQIFPELSFDTISPELNEKLGLYTSKGLPRLLDEKEFTDTQEELIKAEISKIFNSLVKDNINELIKKRIFTINIAPNGATRYLPSGIDTRVLKEYGADINNYLTQASLTNLVASYSLNSVVANVEYTKLFTGDPAMYKNMVDFFKRVPSTYTDGLPLRLGMTAGDKHFNISVLENQVVQSPYLDEIKDSLKKVGKTEAQIKEITNLYEDDVNSTDAQAWITPQRWKFIIERTGKWNDRRQRVYDHMMGNTTKPLEYEDFKYAAQPLKGVYFGVVNGVPTYLKYSQAVMIPSMIKGTQLENLYNSMVKSNIDEAITLDGIKVGAKTPNRITDDNGNITQTNLTSITLNNSEWKLQQDLPTKLMKPTLIGSQIQKNIYSSINPDAPYYQADGSVLTGLEMIDQINDALSKMSNKGIENLSLSLGLDENSTIDKDRFYAILEKEVLDGNYSLNTIKAVQKGMPLEALPGLKNKLNNMFFSKVRSAAVKIKSNGGSFIQMSNFGLDKNLADKVGVKWLVEPDVLKPPFIQEIDGINKVTPGQIFINHSLIAKYIPNYESMSIEQLNDKIDSRLLQAIGYRIPNQGMSSNDPLQIVGILPPTMGDTIVGYTEIPTKTGSDFDIDKMYVMLPEYSAQYSKSTFKKVREFLNKGLEGLSIEQENKMLGDIIDQSNIELTVEQTKNLLFASNEYDTNDVYFNSIVEHIMDSNSTSQLSVQYREDYNIDKVESIKYVESKGDNKKALNNKLFELYWSVLINENTYADLITPIDFDYLKNHVKYLHGDNSKQSGENLKFYNPLFQLKLKHIYSGGKSGVGITATQLVDHNRSKHVVNLKFRNYNLGVGYNIDGETVFDTIDGDNLSEKLKSNNKDFNGTQFKISDTISAFLNAFVDNAKDPYINDGNYNTYTSGVAFMMIRAGVHPYYVNSFIGQPIIKELAQFVKDYESKSTTKDKAWKSSKQVFKEEYAKKILGNNVSDKEIATFLKGFESATVKSYDELESNILNPVVDRDTDFFREQLNVLSKFEEYVDQAKKLNDSVALSRMDTEGAGKNFVDMNITINKIKELLASENEEKALVNHMNKYVQNGKLTSLGTQVLNTLEYSRNIINNNDNLFLLSSEPVIDIMNNITMNTINSTGGSMGLIKDETIGNLVSNEIYSYIMTKFPALKVQGNKLDFIKNTLNDVIDYKNDQSEDVDERNFFIDSLVFYEESFGLNFGNMSKEVKDQLYRSFRDLYINNTTLGNKIIKSAFHMNGFNSNLIDFRDFIPHEFFIKNDFRNFLRKEAITLQNNEYSDDFITKFVRTNSDNNKLVPVVSPKRIKSVTHRVNDKHPTISFSIDSSNELNARAYGLGKNSNGSIMYPRFLKMANGALFELHGYINSDPYYKRIEQLGYKNKKSHLNIREYDNNKSEFNSNPDIVKAIEESEKKALGYSKSVNYTPRDLFNTFSIPNIYIKNLSEILSPQENVVSLQEETNNLPSELNKDKNIFKIGNAFYKKIGEPFEIDKSKIKNYTYSDIIEYLGNIPIPKKFGTNIFQRKLYEITDNRNINAVESLINETKDLDIDFSSLDNNIINLMKSAQNEFENLNKNIPQTKEEGDRFIELLKYKNNLLSEILTIIKNKYNLSNIPLPSDSNNNLVISNMKYLGVINKNGKLVDIRNNNEESPLDCN